MYFCYLYPLHIKFPLNSSNSHSYPNLQMCKSHCPECPSKSCFQPLSQSTPTHPTDIGPNAPFLKKVLLGIPTSKSSNSPYHQVVNSQDLSFLMFITVHLNNYMFICVVVQLITGFRHYFGPMFSLLICVQNQKECIRLIKASPKYLQNEQ